jgi:hypothetical protein
MEGSEPPFRARGALQAGVVQTNPITSQQITNITFILNGWGLAIRDLNADGWPDLVLGGKPGWGGIHFSDLGNSPTQLLDWPKQFKNLPSQGF